MADIRPIPDEHLDEFVRIIADAYPGMKIISAEDRRKQRDKLIKQNRDPRISTHGYYRGDRLLGGIRLHDYTMTVRGAPVPTGGGGFLAVDLMHKKEHVGKELMLFYFRHYRRRETPMAVLWPFRPDFYRRMGCGYGGKIHQYRIKAQHLPCGDSKAHVRYLTRKDIPALVDCYNGYAARTTGMIQDQAVSREYWFDEYPRFKWAGYERDGRLEGYLLFDFAPAQPETYLNNDLRVHELIFENREALLELMTFLHTQADQINRIVISTPDDDFHHVLLDPRNDTLHVVQPAYHECHTSGIGIMYRVLSIPTVFDLLQQPCFGSESCTVHLHITDSFLPDNDGSHVVRFEGGRASLQENGNAEIELRLDVSDFSSLIMGAVDLRSLYTYSRAELSDHSRLEVLNRIFATDHRPVCTTWF
jgi:predicted acetyltransferase